MLELWQWLGRGGSSGGRAGGQEAVGVSVEVFVVLSKDEVLQRFLEEIIDDLCLVRVQQRFEEQDLERPASEVWRGSAGAVLRREQASRAVLAWKPGHYLCDLPCAGGHLPSCSSDSQRRLLEEFLSFFYVTLSPRRSHLKIWIFSTSPLYLTVARPGRVTWRRLLNELHAFST